jgi:predicted metal-dependent peptidase
MTKIDQAPEEKEFDREEFEEIALDLEKHYSIFEKMWSLGKPSFSNAIPSASIEFDKIGTATRFIFNPEYWAKKNIEQKKFIISHECLHGILLHGVRFAELEAPEERMIANIAMDVIVNETLVTKFGFKREEIDPENQYYWKDVVGLEKYDLHSLYYEFVYNKIKQNQEGAAGNNKKDQKSSSSGQGQGSAQGKEGQDKPGDGGGGEKKEEGEGQGKEQEKKDQQGQGQGKPQEAKEGQGQRGTVDEHSLLPTMGQEFMEELGEKLSNQEKKELKDLIEDAFSNDPGGKMAGKIAGSLTVILNKVHVKAKKKWETVIKKWAALKIKDKDDDQWARTPRRMFNMHNDFFLPTEMEYEGYEKDKIEVLFFQDTSGSCAHLAERFFKAAASLPKERFDIILCCFDTRVYETSLESRKLYGFGGTSFSCLERWIQDAIRSKRLKAYPKAIFTITDGYGDRIYPPKEKEKNWHWFLSENYRHCIPEGCNIYMLKDFE